MKKVIIIVVIIAIVGAGAFVLMGGSDSSDSTNNQTTTTDTTSDDGSAEVSGDVAATIVYTGSGFDVDNEIVPSGSIVEVVNQSEEILDFASNVHPVHSDNTEFNAGSIEPDDSKRFVVNETGTWGFHNHLNSAHTGEITVE